MKKILILAGRYLPGFKDGGPVRTLINLTDLLGDEYDFRIVVLDRDHGDTESYPNIKVNEWNRVGKASVWYYRPGEMHFSLIRKLAKDVDLIYLCGFYDDYGYKTLILNRANKLWNKPVFIASMGSFTKGALSQKSLKKKMFIYFCSMLGLFNKVTWSVTSELEKIDTQNIMGKKTNCIIAEDLPRSVINGHKEVMSNEGALKIAFVARICRHKNLMLLIHSLGKVSGNVSLTIGGAMEDKGYWKECIQYLNRLPANIHWKYVGEIDSENVPEFLAHYDVLVLPTLGENYCHVVYEALSSGCIPIISDRTPWNWIQEFGCGYVIPLESEKKYVQIIQEITELPVEKKQELSDKAVCAAKYKLQQNREYTGYKEIFQ